ncbi:hypothetical protein [Actinospica sp.]|uniref:hypothetical protein n=1 Tax=Actinospica sp. TaxID=1872142 RepID=UPI002BC5D22E|nr:hypothetical protein [Actinospica sp.]HWG25054.1 hypothetical protein [Actinospica sp.]
MLLPVPFLRSIGVGGMLIPLVATVAALTLLPITLAVGDQRSTAAVWGGGRARTAGAGSAGDA